MDLDISVIVPIYNEEESVGPLYEKVVEAMEPLGRPFEMVLVDDGSSDRSFPLLEEMAARDPRLVLLKFRQNAGQTAAMMAGIEYARGKYLVTMDGDLQNDPADIPMMLSKLEDGFDLVIGWRMNRQDKWLSRKLPSMIANRLIGRVTGLPVKDNGCSLKVYRASVIKRVPLYSDMHRFIPAMTVPLGARIAEVGVRHHARQFGESKYGLSRIFKVFIDLIAIKTLLLFARRPLRRFSGLAFVAGLLALVFAWPILSISASSETASVMVHTSVALLFAQLSLFLVLLGSVGSLIHNRLSREDRNWIDGPTGPLVLDTSNDAS